MILPSGHLFGIDEGIRLEIGMLEIARQKSHLRAWVKALRFVAGLNYPSLYPGGGPF
jgi:hypothetical protein